MNSHIKTLSLGKFDNFIHFIIDKNSGLTFIVDPAWDSDAILRLLSKQKLKLSGILLTHSHFDHTSSVDDLLAVKNVPVYLTKQEYELGKIKLDNPSFIADEDNLLLGNTTIKAIATPGHTSGSVCYLVDNNLISGDTLFIDGCGHCDFHESDVNKMWESLQRLKTLPDETIIYCGHDYGQKKIDTLGKQKLTNPYLLIEDKDFFIDFRMHLQSKYRSIPFVPSSAAEIIKIYKKYS